MKIGSGRWLTMTGRGSGLRARFTVAVVALLVASVGFATGVAAQEDEHIPTVPPGTPAVLFPVQSALPTPGGAWLGGASSEQEVLQALHAEIAFAFGEERDAESWALPDELVRRLDRNPTLHVNPYRMAYQGLLRKPEKHDQITEPLHTQMRQVAALFDARLVVLPMRVRYQPEPLEEQANELERDAADEASGAPREALGRAVLLAAVIDTRRSAVLWHGEIEGAADTLDSSVLLTSLAFRLADHLIP